MPESLIPMFFVVLVWWLGTGVVLRMKQPGQRRGGSGDVGLLLIASALSVTLLIISARHTSILAHLTGFTAAVLLWGCIELSYYRGWVTGTHRQPCPQDSSSWQRFHLGLKSSLWHELLVLVSGVLLTALLWQAANPTGWHAFLVLWLMRWTAKLNLFVGVPHFSTAWFPTHLHYLRSYMRQRPVSLFFLLSVGLATLVAITLLTRALRVEGTASLSLYLPAVLLCLAIIEHVFMALPIADHKLWNSVFHPTLSDRPLSDTQEHRGEHP